jgi:hypothetical protein
MGDKILFQLGDSAYWWFVILVRILLGLAILGCGSTTRLGLTATSPGQTSAGNVIVATDKHSQITVPDDWQAMTDLNDKAETQAGNRSKNVYVIIIADNKEDFTSFSKYSELAISKFMATLEAPEVKGPANVTINGNSALQYKIMGAVNGLKVTYLYTLVEGDSDYYQILAWTTQSKFDENEPIFQRVAQSFQELSR